MTQPNNSSRFKLACGLWIATTLLLLTLYFAGLPAYYHSILEQPSGRITDDPALLRAFLAQLGLSPELYAARELLQSLGVKMALAVIGLALFWRKVWPERHALAAPWGLWALSFVIIWVGTSGGNAAGGSEFIPFSQPILVHLVRFFVALATAAFPVFFYIFPDGRFTPAWTRWTTLLFLLFSFATTYSPGFMAKVPLWVVFPLIFTFIYAPASRYRRADPAQRLQMKWGLLGLIATPTAWLIGGVLNTTMPQLFQSTPAGLRNEIVFDLAMLPLYLMGPIGIGIAVLRSRLWDIDVIIRRTLIYSVLTGLLALAYFGTVVTLQTIFAPFGSQRSELIAVLSTLTIAALFSPFRRRVQWLIDRRFFRQKYDAAQTLAAFAARARDEVELDILTAELVLVVQETMHPENVTLWLKPDKIHHLAHLASLPPFHQKSPAPSPTPSPPL